MGRSEYSGLSYHPLRSHRRRRRGCSSAGSRTLSRRRSSLPELPGPPASRGTERASQPHGWNVVRTQADASGFRYEVASQGGSGYIRSRVFTAALEAERKMSATGTAHLAAITPDNYYFEDRGAQPGGLAWVGLVPRRKDLMLVQGSIFLRHEDGDLVQDPRVAGKTTFLLDPACQHDRRYERRGRADAGVAPVGRTRAGHRKSTFTVTYQYERVNGQQVGSPVPRPNAPVDGPEPADSARTVSRQFAADSRRISLTLTWAGCSATANGTGLVGLPAVFPCELPTSCL